jgi:hypothetical protein
MKPSRNTVLAIAAVVAAAVAAPAAASFHLMQIEHVTGEFCGDTSAQAIQLRMRTAGQNLVAGARLVARDAAGANPVVLLVIPSNVSSSATGSRILVTSMGFGARAGGPAADFTLTNRIPASYLAAGRLTFEISGGGIIYWSLAWGGGLYTGSNAGAIDNDADGNFGPPFAGDLVANGDQTVQFQGIATAPSTNNAADYALSASPATLTNNAGGAAPLSGCIFFDGFESGDSSGWSATVP